MARQSDKDNLFQTEMVKIYTLLHTKIALKPGFKATYTYIAHIYGSSPGILCPFIVIISAGVPTNSLCFIGISLGTLLSKLFLHSNTENRLRNRISPEVLHDDRTNLFNSRVRGCKTRLRITPAPRFVN